MHLRENTQLQGGEYTIIRFINSGGFGCTYEAYQKSLDRRVAIKELFWKEHCNRDPHTGIVTISSDNNRTQFDRLRKKFIDEAKVLSRIIHSGIVRVSAVFEENGTAYYVMDYVDGYSLSDKIKRQGIIPEDEALNYIRNIASILQYIHNLNRLHLDIKPSNIMIDNEDNIILIDFGISKQYDREGHNSTSLQGYTRGYAPIEQMDGCVKNFTPATDIYALGATLYHMLTGCCPPSATDIIKGLPSHALDKHDISDSTIHAITVAMQVDKNDRPQSIADFIDLLDRKIDNITVGKHDKTENTSEETIIPAIEVVSTPSEETELPDTTPTPSPHKEKKKSNLTGLWLVLIALILISGIGIIRGWKKHEPNDNTFTPTSYIEGQGYIDLGLSVMWATCNIGANSPEDFGDYFAWGETHYKDNYRSENCLTLNKEIDDISGNIQHDAAQKIWGGQWRIPTHDECQELLDSCLWEYMTLNNINGYKVTSKINGKSIFLPVTDKVHTASTDNNTICTMYRTSTPYHTNEFDNDTEFAYCININTQKVAPYYRWCGLAIRPVWSKNIAENIDKETDISSLQTIKEEEQQQAQKQATTSGQPSRGYINGYEWVDLGLPSGTKWATCNVGATSPEQFGDYYAWGEIKPKDEYTRENCTTFEKEMEDISGNALYDVARANWGGIWRMPTKAECEELEDNCWNGGLLTCRREIRNGVSGCKITSKVNGNSIFLPAAHAGRGINNTISEVTIWTSTPGKNKGFTTDNLYAIALCFSNTLYVDYGDLRYEGFSVRPVCMGWGIKKRTPTTQNSYKIGDYYNNNGIEGVVFDVSEGGRHGKILSMTQSHEDWCTSTQHEKNLLIGASSNQDGLFNTNKILSRSDSDEYSAFVWCREKGENWYLPSIEEYKEMNKNIKIINETLAMYGGDSLKGWYLTSTEYDSQSAWHILLWDNSATPSYTTKNTSSGVRAIATF